MEHTGKNTSIVIKLIAGVTAISFSPLAVKLVSFGPSVSAFYRSFYAALIFLAFAAIGRAARGDAPREPGNMRWILPSVYAGIFLGVDLFVWHKTILYVGAGPATFLGNSQILFMTPFAAFVFKERIPKLFYLILAMVIAGLYLLMPAATPGVTRPVGYLMGLFVGMTYAGMLICLRYAKNLSGETYPETLSLAVVFAVSAAAILVCGWVEGASFLVWDGRSHAVMALTAFFCQSFGWYMINSNLLKIPAHEGSLLLMLQPLLAMTWGCVFFNEPLSAVQALGIVLSLAGILWYQAVKKEDEARKVVEIESEEVV